MVGPVIDIVSIGAGGGSIAWIDELGAVRVGPHSAGASPGPACFGLGGTEPTVTDCHLILGRLDSETFLGGRMRLDVAAAEEALQSRIARPLGLGLVEAAAGVLAIAQTNMVFAIRAVTVERGLDPREFVVFSYGGGGGLFAAAVAEELEVPAVLVPRAPANFSAWGILTSDYREDVAVTTVRPLDESSAAEAAAILRQLAEEAAANLERYGFTEGQVERIYRANIRYAGQVTSRARAVGHIARSSVSEPATLEQVPPQEFRQVFFGARGRVETAVHQRETFASASGPAIVEEWATTVVVPPGWSAQVDRLGNLLLQRER